MSGATPRYLTNYPSTNGNPVYNTRASDKNNIRRFQPKTEHFKQSLFSFCVNEWYKLDNSWEKLKVSNILSLYIRSFLKENVRSFQKLKQVMGWSRADLKSAYWFWGHLIWASKFRKGRKRKTNFVHKNKKTRL